MTDPDDIDRLILELHSTGGHATSSGDAARLERWLRLLASRNGSDLLLVAGAPPSLRVDGRIQPLAEGPLDGVDIEETVLPALPPHARRIYRESHIVDASFRVTGVGRFRINLHRERGRAAAAVRLLPTRVPRLVDARAAAFGRAAVAAAARSRPHRRTDGLGQEHDPCGARRGNQPARRPSHRHDRGSDRVRARP